MRRIILIGFLVAVSQVFAGPAAIVLFTAKIVIANNNGKARVLSRGARLDPGDQISTPKGGVANIQYSNGTLVNIGEESSYKILAYSPKQADIQIKAELSRGKIEIKNTGKIKETLQTPITPLAILGTHINVYVPSAKITYIRVTEGLVLVKNDYLRPGDSVSATQNSLINAPFPKIGTVDLPLNAPGSIRAGSLGSSGGSVSDSSGSKSSSSSSSGSGDSSSSSSGSGSSSSSSGSSGASAGAQTVTFVATNQGVGSSTASGAGSVQTALAVISLACIP